MAFPTSFGNNLQSKNTVVNHGNVKTPVVMTIYGELKDATIRNLTTLKSISLIMKIEQFEKVMIYTQFGKKRIVKVAQDGTVTNAMQYLALTDSDFWDLLPGNNVIEFVTNTNTSGYLKLEYHTRYSGV